MNNSKTDREVDMSEVEQELKQIRMLLEKLVKNTKHAHSRSLVGMSRAELHSGEMTLPAQSRI